MLFAKAHVARIGSLGKTVVHLFNATEPSACRYDDVGQTIRAIFNGVRSSSTLSDSTFWPNPSDSATIIAKQNMIIAEFSRTIGISKKTTHTFTETLHLPGAGDVKLIQIVDGTMLSSTMEFGLCAPSLGIKQQLFNDFSWHQVSLVHCDAQGDPVGEYVIDFCQYYFGSYFSGLYKGKIDIARRSLWNLGIAYLVRKVIGLPVVDCKSDAYKERKDWVQKTFFDPVKAQLMPIDNAYELLGVEKSATQDDIKKQYKKLVLKWHPDRNKDNVAVATEKFQQINTANEILSDDTKRSLYDTGSKMLTADAFLTKLLKVYTGLKVCAVAAMAMLVSRPMPYSNILYKVTYNRF